MTGPRIAAWEGNSAELELAANLYAHTFAEPPYDEDIEASRTGFIAQVHRYRASNPHFRLIFAWEGAELTGLVMGTGITAGDWWRDHVIDFLDADQQAIWLQDECFAVVELAVSSVKRRSGLARTLVDAVFKDLPYETAVLGSSSAALPAREFYAAQGWTEIAADVRIDNSPAFCILGRNIH